jgi:hypothetical protein
MSRQPSKLLALGASLAASVALLVRSGAAVRKPLSLIRRLLSEWPWSKTARAA